MEHGVSESISQRSSGEKAKENCRIQAIINELDRRCQVYETQYGNGEKSVNRFEAEQREAEIIAKENGYWIPINHMFDLGMPGPCGNENDTYVDENIIYKVNNLLNSGGICNLLKRIILHNTVFPETYYRLHGFTGYEGRSIMPVLKQDLIKDAIPATAIEIDTYMSAIGFIKVNSVGKFENKDCVIWDIVPRNVLRDKEGDIYVIDAELTKK